MLILDVVLHENYDEEKKRFVDETFRLEMEHSLASLSKWESFFEKPFLSDEEKTPEELMWYVQAMTLTPDVPPEVFAKLTPANVQEIDNYINAKMTATTFREVANRSGPRQIVTAEIIYHMMISLNIWPECQYWHLSRLITLIKVCNEKNAPPKKMSRKDMIAERNRLNEERRARYGSTG